MKLPSSPFQGYRIVSVSLWIVLGLSLSLHHLACEPVEIQLDENWTSPKPDGSIGTHPDQGTTKESDPAITDQNTDSPLVADGPKCVKATSQQLMILPNPAINRKSLLVGMLGSEAAGKVVQVKVPSNWVSSPSQVTADAQGNFGFVVDRMKAKLTGEELLSVFHRDQWCYIINVEENEGSAPTKLKMPPSLVCKVGENKDITLELQGKIKEAVLGYSSDPSFAEVSQFQFSSPGKPSLTFQLHCKKEGTLHIIMGGQDLEAEIIPLTIMP